MKKLFSFLCALVCAVSLSAQTYYITGSPATLFGEAWNPAGMALDQQTDGTWKKEFTACENGKEYQFKVTDGTWSNTWGYDALVSVPDGVTKNNDGNIVCTTYDANMTVVFNPTTNKITLTGVFTNGEGGGDTPDPVVYSIKHAWKDGQSASWSYKDLTPNGDGTYSIRDIYGGTGCNWKSTVSEEKWVASPTLVGNPAVGDSAIFTLTSTEGDGAITITKITTGGGEGGEGGNTDPDPVVYSIKHAWKDGQQASWSYKDLTPNGDGTYSIRDIYGGTGCNWKSTVSEEKWVASPTLVGNPAVGDSAIFTLTSTEGDGAITITKITTGGGEGGEGGGEGGGDTPDPVINDTVFFVNAADWTGTISCYAWNEGSNDNGGWPGVEMTKTSYQLKDKDVYYYATTKGAYEKCIFNNKKNNDGGQQTDNLIWTSGKYYYNGAWFTREALESDEPIGDIITYGIGSNKNGYKPGNDPMTVSEDNTKATCTIDLTENEEFLFSVVKTTNGSAAWLKNTETTITRDNNSVVLAENGAQDNTAMTVDATGTYTFVFTIDSSTITVIYPSSGASSALSNAAVEDAAVKVIRDGQVLIVREGVTYNMMGQIIQ
ncbi:MAG: starch-binding protein [Paludibacteraceae bacterium]